MTLNIDLYTSFIGGAIAPFSIYTLIKAQPFSFSFLLGGSIFICVSFNIILQKVQPYSLFDGGAVAFSVLC